MGAQIRFLSIRQTAAASVAVLATQSVTYGLHAVHSSAHRRLASAAAYPGFPIGRHGMALILGAALLALTPGLWRGTRTAVSLTIIGLVALAALNAGHGRYGDAAVEASTALLLALGRGAFRLGCSNRPGPVVACAALVAWGLAAGAILSAPAVRHTAGHVIAVLHHPSGRALTTASVPRISGPWDALIDVLIAGAVTISVLALRSLVRPASASNDHADHEYRAARAIIDAHGSDSLSPFLLRRDKALAFAAGGVLGYRVIGGTAVISADPVAPAGAAAKVLAAFQDQARRRGWRLVLWGAAETHLEDYRRMGLHAVCVGQEAFVDPGTFSLEGRAVRKLRQSVHRVARRGWQITAHDGREIDAWLETEIELLSARWRDDHPRVHGFAMGMGSFTAELRPDDLYLLARSPAGELGGVMRFVTFGERLSLDTMQRVGDTPNGLNEALVSRALEVARSRGVPEVSLNYAGLAHLVRGEPSRNRVVRGLTRMALGPLHRRFQMDRLVRFNEKFSPQWRPRYLVYESRAALPRAVVRVLQAEGYLPHHGRTRLGDALREGVPRALPARLRPPGPIGQMR